MKRLDSRDAAKHSQKLVLNRETLRRLDGKDMAQAVGGATLYPSCLQCTTTKQPNNETTP